MNKSSMSPLSQILVDALEKRIQWEELSTEYRKTRDGWAGYKGDRRITKFVFTEDRARDLASEWESSDVRVEWVEP